MVPSGQIGNYLKHLLANLYEVRSESIRLIACLMELHHFVHYLFEIFLEPTLTPLEFGLAHLKHQLIIFLLKSHTFSL